MNKIQSKSLQSEFLLGLRDALPVCFGYLSVSFAFGMISVAGGLNPFIPILISATSFTGTGQFIGVDMMLSAASFLQFVVTLLIINARYILMSLSLGQRLPENITLSQRFLIAFGNTDEIFAIAMSRRTPISFKYFMGMVLCAWCGWTGGTALGGLLGSVIPQAILSAMGIALYAMFLAIIIPPAKKERSVLFVIASGAILSCLMHFVPLLSSLDDGWIIIISGIAASAAGALLFPVCIENKNGPFPMDQDGSGATREERNTSDIQKLKN
ncbi:MAG: AzlC family ABC transporter permease [Firmicutes bacterium]|nr:AzlC family ABC transporter permease [Bacillota bacterium]